MIAGGAVMIAGLIIGNTLGYITAGVGVAVGVYGATIYF